MDATLTLVIYLALNFYALSWGKKENKKEGIKNENYHIKLHQTSNCDVALLLTDDKVRWRTSTDYPHRTN
jgi:hypothetical protein